MGIRSHWLLSHALFSSNAIDDGSILLLKTLANRVPLEKMNTVLDIGCGIGILGGAIKTRFPHLAVSLQDRDATAIALALQNFKLNKIKAEETSGHLALQGISSRYDLIVSNLPAKAGKNVLQEFIHKAPAFLNPSGIVAVVVISALSAGIKAAIISSAARLLYEEETKRYSVFHFSAETGIPAASVDLSSYIRQKTGFRSGSGSCTLDTVHNLPEFDTPSHDTTAALRLLEKHKVSGSTAIYNPGQGHLPVYLAQRSAIKGISLFSRDRLQLEISLHNIKNTATRQYHLPFPPAELPQDTNPFQLLLVRAEKIPGVPADEYWPFALKALASDGRLLCYGTSTHMHSIEKSKPGGMILKDSFKHKGYRALFFEKKSL